jgi:hypothetical protein
MNINIVAVNIAGSAGKSTFVKHCLVPQVPNASSIAIEDWNSGDGAVDLEIGSRSFHELAEQLNVDEGRSFVLDVGTSNSKAMLKHFGDLELTRQEIDYWAVPTRAGSKERIDTLRTIAHLLDLNIDPATIIVIPQAVAEIAAFESDFADLRESSLQLGCFFSREPVLYSEIYHLLKGRDQSVFDIVRTKPNFKEARTNCKGDEKELLRIGHQMLMYSLSATAVRNLMCVFENTPLAGAVAQA